MRTTTTTTTTTTPTTPYTQVQGLPFRIYTGGAPAYLKHSHTKNPECNDHHSYGQNANTFKLQCYLGNPDPIVDVQRRVEIMREAVERAYELSDKSPSTLKIFIAPEFFWRGVLGAYVFADDQGDDDCGPICVLLRDLEALVADAKYKDWLFLFGTVIASEVLPKEDVFDYLFYNFAPVYKGYDPSITTFQGKRFLVPKRYVSSSDFLTPKRHVNQTLTKELLDHEHYQRDKTVFNPFDFQQKRYNNDMWVHYKDELTRLGYTMIEYDWVMVDGISLTIEICFDHYRRTALNSYLADIISGGTTLIPSSTNEGLEYVHIPQYQAQISLVSSAGMMVDENSLALTNNGTIFLQDGVNHDPPLMNVSKNAVEFTGGVESVQRKAILTSTDVFFEYKMRHDYERHSVWDNWKDVVRGTFSTEKYEPLITVYDSIDIAKVMT